MPRNRTKENPIRAYLQRLEKTVLVDLILEHADEAFRDHLELQSARNQPKGPDLARFRKHLRALLDDLDGWDRWTAAEGAEGLSRFAESLQGLIADGHPSGAMELAREALEGLEEVYGNTDDSDGCLGDAAAELRAVHRLACGLAGPEPRVLAEWVYRMEMRSDFGLFDGLLEEYRAVLGEAGLAHIRRLAEQQWDQFPPLGPRKEGPSSLDYDRARITSLMKNLTADDANAGLEVRLRDLSSSYRFLEVAEFCLRSGWPDRAVEWAEKGLRAFPVADSRLQDFLAERFAASGRHDEALELRWTIFQARPELDSYQALIASAAKWGGALAARERALSFLQARFETNRNHPNRFQRSDLNLVTRIHLAEKAPLDALKAAQAGGCSQATWMALAQRLEEGHPEAALPILQAQMDALIAPKNDEAYKDAVAVLKRIQALAIRLQKPGAFATSLAQVMTTHGRKRNLVARIQKAGLG